MLLKKRKRKMKKERGMGGVLWYIIINQSFEKFAVLFFKVTVTVKVQCFTECPGGIF